MPLQSRVTAEVGTDAIVAVALRRGAQPRFSHPAGECAVGNLAPMLLREQLARPHHIAAGALKASVQQAERLRIAGRGLGGAGVWRAQDAAHTVTRELE